MARAKYKLLRLNKLRGTSTDHCQFSGSLWTKFANQSIVPPDVGSNPERGNEKKEIYMTAKLFTLMSLWLVWTMLIACPAQAQRKPMSTFVVNVPFEFVVGNRTLPAGPYEFRFALGPASDSDLNVLAVRSLYGRYYQAVVTGVTPRRPSPTNANLTFQRYGDQLFLSQVSEAGKDVGLQLHIPPLTEPVAARLNDEVITLASSINER